MPKRPIVNICKSRKIVSTSTPQRRYVLMWRLIQYVDFSFIVQLDSRPVRAAAESLPGNQAGLPAACKRASVWRLVGRAIGLFRQPAGLGSQFGLEFDHKLQRS